MACLHSSPSVVSGASSNSGQIPRRWLLFPSSLTSGQSIRRGQSIRSVRVCLGFCGPSFRQCDQVTTCFKPTLPGWPNDCETVETTSSHIASRGRGGGSLDESAASDVKANIQLLTVDHSARGSMKTAASCVSVCESQEYQIHRQVERTLRRRHSHVLPSLLHEGRISN